MNLGLHTAYAENELQFSVNAAKPPSGVYLTLPDQSRQDCQSGKVTPSGATLFTCSIEGFQHLDSINTYFLVIEGGDLIVRPIGIRVYPIMKTPTLITLDLTDKIFSKDFVSSHDYYTSWLQLDQTRDPKDWNQYLITRNLYYKLVPGINSTTAYVLRRWVERARFTSENIPFQPSDDDALDAAATAPSRAQTPAELAALKKFGPVEDENGNLTDTLRLRYADWYIFAISLKASLSEAQRRHADFCRMYEAFLNKWKNSNSQDKSYVSTIWGVSESIITSPDSSKNFSGCKINQATNLPFTLPNYSNER